MEKPVEQLKIAKERIAILFNEAQKTVKEDPELAKRYTRLAKKIGMRYNIRLGRLKRRFCKYCYNYFLPGVSCRQRLNKGKVSIKCFSCDKTIHYPYKNIKKK
ncbi:MAG: ribonuclease P [Candidatus Aenigmatarchaeota archaeon]